MSIIQKGKDMIYVSKADSTEYGGGGKTLSLAFRYDKNFVKLVSGLPKRRYNPYSKEWLIPSYELPDLMQELDEDDVELDDGLFEELQKKGLFTEEDPKIYVSKSNWEKFGDNVKTLSLTFPYDSDFIEAIKELPEKYFDDSTKEWLIPAYSLIDLMQEVGEDNVELDEELVEAIQKSGLPDKEDPKIHVSKTDRTDFGDNGRTLCLTFRYDSDLVGLVRMLSERHYDVDTGEWFIPAYALTDLIYNAGEDTVRLDEGLSVEMQSETLSVKERLDGITPAAKFDFKTTCYSHQIEAFNVGIAQNELLIADEQGLGKTKESIDIMTYRHEKGQVGKCLIVCGVNSTKYNWQKEIGIHSDEKCVMIDGSSAKVKMKQIDEWINGDALFGIFQIN